MPILSGHIPPPPSSALHLPLFASAISTHPLLGIWILLLQLTCSTPNFRLQVSHFGLRRVLPQRPQQLAERFTRDLTRALLVKEGVGFSVLCSSVYVLRKGSSSVTEVAGLARVARQSWPSCIVGWSAGMGELSAYRRCCWTVCQLLRRDRISVLL